MRWCCFRNTRAAHEAPFDSDIHTKGSTFQTIWKSIFDLNKRQGSYQYEWKRKHLKLALAACDQSKPTPCQPRSDGSRRWARTAWPCMPATQVARRDSAILAMLWTRFISLLPANLVYHSSDTTGRGTQHRLHLMDVRVPREHRILHQQVFLCCTQITRAFGHINFAWANNSWVLNGLNPFTNKY